MKSSLFMLFVLAGMSLRANANEYDEAMNAMGSGDYDLAIGLLTKVLRHEPKNYMAFVKRGIAQTKSRYIRPEVAIEDFNAAIRCNSACAEAYAYRGVETLLLRPEAKVDDSPGALERYLAEWNRVAASNERRAMEDFNKAISLDRSNPVAHFGRGKVIAREERSRALAELNEAISGGFSSNEAYEMRGVLLLLAEDANKALTDFERIIASGADDSVLEEAEFGRLMALWKLERWKEVKSALEKRAFDKDAGYADAIPAAVFHLTCPDPRYSDRKIGLQLAEKAWAEDQDMAEVYTLIEAYAKNGRFAAAERLTGQIVSNFELQGKESEVPAEVVQEFKEMLSSFRKQKPCASKFISEYWSPWKLFFEIWPKR